MSDITIYTSFAELFNNDVTNVKEVVIPKIQRGYAQGRLDEHATRTRNRFLKAIREALDTGEGMTLDFVYGHNQDGMLIPLDGQQRLTTLFLLHWYAAKKENLDDGETNFLQHFTYTTRYSARDFCKNLVAFNPFVSLEEKKISEEIKDQVWFPSDWTNDGTVSSMLVMLDAINDKFGDIQDLWNKLNGIKFYFLPLEELALTDEIYIKMNSRGKPLSDFENFKAELQKSLTEFAPDKAKEVADKIDTKWTDLLWPYAEGKENSDGQPTTDDAFLRYFRFICDILCYNSDNSPKKNDEFELLEQYFSGDKAADNVQVMINFFDCWEPLTKEDNSIEAFFNSIACVGKHEKGKARLNDRYAVNLFKDCINDYSELRGSRARKFPLNKIILLYAVIIYLLHREEVSEDNFRHRFRIVNNLVLNSSDEISDSENRDGGNRMPAILRQVDSIIVKGFVADNICVTGNVTRPNFNVKQLEEEREKQKFINDHSEYEESLNQLEDHPLLTGQIAIMGLDRPDLFGCFEKLFDCDWDKVDCGLFAMGNYSQRDNWWRVQVGTSNRVLSTAWINLFHQKQNEEDFTKTKECLRALLIALGNDISDNHLDEIVKSYITKCEAENSYDLRYYYLKYDNFRFGRYGRYELHTDRPYHLVSIYAAQYASSNSKEVFLQAMAPSCNYVDYNHVYLGEYRIENEETEIAVYSSAEDNEEKKIDSITIPRKDGVDEVNRVELGKGFLKKYEPIE